MNDFKDRYINFFTDFGFKKLFGSEPSKDCLIDFLNSLLEGMEEPIKELQFRKNENLGSAAFNRKAIFDLYCESESGGRFIVELQKAKQNFFKDRSVFYSTFPIQEQAQRGREWDFRLDAVYTIGILDFVFDDDSDTPEKYLYNVKLSELETHEVFYDKLTFVYIEMPRFKKSLADLETHQDKWIYALKNLSILTDIPAEFRDDIFLKFFEIAEIAQLNTQERDAYEDSLKVYWDNINTMNYALQEAVQEGRKEEKLLIAKNLLATGVFVDTVVKATGLSVDEVNKL